MEDSRKKAAYAKPQLKEVQLELNEAVLAGCKTETGAPASKTNGKCLPSGMCLDVGS